MISFIVCLLLLITGYLTYGKIVDKTFGPDDRETPAVRINAVSYTHLDLRFAVRADDVLPRTGRAAERACRDGRVHAALL